MATRQKKSKHTGLTRNGNVRDRNVERIGRVTIYQRGKTYSLYYREAGQSVRRKLDGNLVTARATAAKVSAALLEDRPSPLGFNRTTPEAMITGYLETITHVQKLALRTQDRYRAALDRFKQFCADKSITAVDAVNKQTIEEFVRWLRSQRRNRNGRRKGKVEAYKTKGIQFILSTCRTTFNWAMRRRMLPPFTENPLSRFGIDKLRDPYETDDHEHVFTADQEKAFFKACNPWQHAIFSTLANYGMRVGELTHLLVDDVDFQAGVIHIRSKPELMWRIKTGLTRELPLTESATATLKKLIGNRTAGFVFLNEPFVDGIESPPRAFADDRAFRQHVRGLIEKHVEAAPAATEREQLRVATRFCRDMGQIPERRLRSEFMEITEKIGCPHHTRVHDLRHLFTSRAQEMGVNPLIVQELLGHTTLDMTRRYTHIGADAKRGVASDRLAAATSPPGQKE